MAPKSAADATSVPHKMFIRWLKRSISTSPTGERKVWLQGFVVEAKDRFVLDDGTGCVHIVVKDRDARQLSHPLGKYLLITGVYRQQTQDVECRQVIDLSASGSR